ncbi:hypothetical protein FGIG_00495 [Fasciola gigantica]|uniref:Uncharacterized protein n=1 Tax=Fasciola gigantica TaxID=46835 RepID=A0A504YS52_FASGI|nr:hypothetical protein FGIG_00495 [Fasciola gigantica]
MRQLNQSVDAIPNEVNLIHRALKYEQSNIIESTLWTIHQLAHARLNELAHRYENSVESVRGACRTQLANTISILRELMNQKQKRELNENEQRLEQNVLDLREELEEKSFEIQLLKQQVEQLKAEREEALSLVSWAPHNYPTAWVQTDSSDRAWRSVATQTGKPVEDEEREKREAFEQLVVELQARNEMLKIALDKSQTYIATVDKRYSNLEEQMQALSDKMSAGAAENAQLRSQLGEHVAENEKLKQQLRASQAQVTDLSSTLRSLRSAVPVTASLDTSSWEIRVNELTNTVESLRRERQFLGDEYARLNDKLNKSLESNKLLQSGSDKKNASTIREQALSAEVSTKNGHSCVLGFVMKMCPSVSSSLTLQIFIY